MRFTAVLKQLLAKVMTTLEKRIRGHR